MTLPSANAPPPLHPPTGGMEADPAARGDPPALPTRRQGQAAQGPLRGQRGPPLPPGGPRPPLVAAEGGPVGGARRTRGAPGPPLRHGAAPGSHRLRRKLRDPSAVRRRHPSNEHIRSSPFMESNVFLFRKGRAGCDLRVSKFIQ